VPTVSTPTAARAVEVEAARRGSRVDYHLKIDTGMHRLGFRHDNLRRRCRTLLENPHMQLEAVYTHFATADMPEHPLFEEQRARFERRSRCSTALGAPACRAMPPTAQRCCATRARGTTPCGPACCSTAWCPRR
jgi:alanine racemase